LFALAVREVAKYKPTSIGKSILRVDESHAVLAQVGGIPFKRRQRRTHHGLGIIGCQYF